MSDPVNHPTHYADGWSNGAEVIDITENLNFNRGNAIKYVARAGKKGDSELEDLKKARWYLDREIARLGGVDLTLVSEGPRARVWEYLIDVPVGTLVSTPNDNFYIYIPSPGTGWYITASADAIKGEISVAPREGWLISSSDTDGPFTEVLDG